MDKQQSEFYQTSEAYYDILSAGSNEYFNEYIQFVTTHVPISAHIIDAGSGLGQSTDRLSSAGYNVTGLDGSHRFVEDGKKRFPHLDIRCGDLEALDFPDNTFDAIASYNTLEHVANVEVVLKEMLRVVKRGGLILIDSPNLLSIRHPLNAFMKTKGITFEGKKGFWELWGMLFRNSILIMQRRLSGTYKFKYREPNYNFSFPDNDASVFLNPVDVELCLRHVGAEIISYQDITHLSHPGIIKRLGAFLFADHMGIIRIVARKV